MAGTRSAFIAASLPWNSPDAQEDYVPARYKTGGGGRAGLSYVLQYDPTPVREGGYKVGATFSREEIKCTLKLGYFCPGTRLVNSLGEVYEVTPKSKGKGLHLKRVKTPE